MTNETNEERLEYIKGLRRIDYSKRHDGFLTNLGIGSVNFLIEQAERVQELEEHQDRWLSGQNVAVSTYNELRKLNEENRLLRVAFEEFKYSVDAELAHLIKPAGRMTIKTRINNALEAPE